MFPHEVARREESADLSVDLGIHALLIGLQPVYAHGLYVGLTATGVRCTVLSAPGGSAPPHEPAQTRVAVVPAGTSPTIDLDDGGTPPAVVHVLADGSAEAYAEALNAGATCAFPLDAELTDIVRTVVCAGLGQTLLPVEVARALNRSSSDRRRPELTPRQLQYLELLAVGATVASLARRFAHSEREMYRQLSATYQKLGAHNRTEALLLAQRFGVFDDQS